MASKAATAGDPRRPGEIKRLTRPAPPDDTVSQLMLMAAMITGVSGMMLKSKGLLWAAAFVLASAVSHMPWQAGPPPQQTQMVMMVVTMLVWAMVQVYGRPEAAMQRRLQQQAAQQQAEKQQAAQQQAAAEVLDS